MHLNFKEYLFVLSLNGNYNSLIIYLITKPVIDSDVSKFGASVIFILH
jgi:hypothetical protein